MDSITKANGQIQVRLSYDAFGKRRNEAGWSGPVPGSDWTAIANSSRRGYTEHEHLDNLGLIHMNGRVQDPLIGRFLSPDPYVPDPWDGQSFNRYSYVRNNPLSRVDPTGFDDFCFPICIRIDAFGPHSGAAIAPNPARSGLISFTPNYTIPLMGELGRSPVLLVDATEVDHLNRQTQLADQVGADSVDATIKVGVILEVAVTERGIRASSALLSAGFGWLNSQWNRATDSVANVADRIEQLSIDLNYATGGILSGPLAAAGITSAAFNRSNIDNTVFWGTFATPFRGLGGARAAEAAAFGRGAVRAVDAPIEATRAGERFVRVGASPESLRMAFSGPGGTRAGTHAFPEATFNQLGRNPAALKNFGDLPGAPPQYFRIFEPPAGTPIQRGIVPGGEYGGIGGVPEVYFPKGF